MAGREKRGRAAGCSAGACSTGSVRCVTRGVGAEPASVPQKGQMLHFSSSTRDYDFWIAISILTISVSTMFYLRLPTIADVDAAKFLNLTLA